MFKTLSTLLALSSVLAGASAYPGQLHSRAASSSSVFSIFAYGSGPDTQIGGYPVFYDNGLAYIANPAKVNYTESYADFTKNETNSMVWEANPLNTGNYTWDESLFYVPKWEGPVGFYKEGVTNVTADDIITDAFKAYGNTIFVSIDGSLESSWYAVATDTDGLWSVGWNSTGGGVLNAEPISLSQGKPVNVNYPEKNKV